MNDDFDILIDMARGYLVKAKARSINDENSAKELLKKAEKIIHGLINSGGGKE